jgi:hypothetical protein
MCSSRTTTTLLLRILAIFIRTPETKKPDLRQMPENQVLPAAAVTIQFLHSISFNRSLNVLRVKT